MTSGGKELLALTERLDRLERSWCTKAVLLESCSRYQAARFLRECARDLRRAVAGTGPTWAELPTDDLQDAADSDIQRYLDEYEGDT